MLVVDGANVVGSRPDGWWRDRPGAARRLHDRLRRAVDDGGVVGPVVLVLEGRARAGVDATDDPVLAVVHAPRDGDDAIVEVVARAEDPAAVTVVTADRALADRARALGGEVIGPRALLDVLP